jgi:hypothetical protein
VATPPPSMSATSTSAPSSSATSTSSQTSDEDPEIINEQERTCNLLSILILRKSSLIYFCRRRRRGWSRVRDLLRVGFWLPTWILKGTCCKIIYENHFVSRYLSISMVFFLTTVHMT